MRFFADHCVPESVAEALESKGHEVLRLRNQMATDAPDPDVVEKAQMFDAVLLSLNGDFSDIVRYPPSTYGGIISMQVRNRPEVLVQIMERLTRYLRDQSDREHYRGSCCWLRRIAFGSEAPHNPHCCRRAAHAAEFCRYASFDGVPVYDATRSVQTIFNVSMPERKSAKKTTLQLVERLDEDVTYEDIMYELYALQKIERGLRDAEEGRTVPHDEVKDHLSQWLK